MLTHVCIQICLTVSIVDRSEDIAEVYPGYKNAADGGMGRAVHVLPVSVPSRL
jgi:hypothetical protein